MIRGLALALGLALTVAGCEFDVELSPAPDGGVVDAAMIDARPIDDAGDDAIGDALGDAAIEPVDAPSAD